MREPYAERFRLILNDLGAGLAARGKDLAAIIARADPALRETDRVLAELASQNQRARQARRRRRHDPGSRSPASASTVSGFINNANVAAEATAERSQDLEAGFQRFPEALHELRLTMAKLRGFSDQATPVFAEFRAGGPAIARATRALGPFAHASEPALISLGTAAAESKQPLVNSDPILRDVRDLAEKAAPGAKARWPARQPPGDRLPQVLDEAPLQHDRRHQRLRPVRPLPPRLAAAQLGLHVPVGAGARLLPTRTSTPASGPGASAAPRRSRRQRAASGVDEAGGVRSGGVREYLKQLREPAAAQPPRVPQARAAGERGVPLDAQGDPAGGGPTGQRCLVRIGRRRAPCWTP